MGYMCICMNGMYVLDVCVGCMHEMYAWYVCVGYMYGNVLMGCMCWIYV